MAGRVTKAPVEVLTLPDTASGRVTKAPVEVLTRPDTASARVTKAVVEVLYPSSNPTGGGARAWGYIIG